MPDLSPAPATLGIGSPVLGPWFQAGDTTDTDLAAIGRPDADLGCSVTVPTAAIWNAPASGLLSYHVAASTRPPALATLRQASGAPAFADNALVLLFTLLPEVAARRGQQAQTPPPAPSGAGAPPGVATPPGIDSLGLEIPPGTLPDIAALQGILPDKDAADLKQVSGGLASDAERAKFVGLDASGGLANAERPAAILRRPETTDARLLENQSGAPLSAKLWTFDINGRPYDAGALAALWAHLAGTAWDNLWAASGGARQRTADFASHKIVHFVSAHEGPLEAPIKARISGQLTDLTAIGSSDVLFEAGGSPAIAISSATNADQDTLPIPRIAPLPAGPYTASDSATPFAGWSAPAALARDFLRVAITDVEAMTVGLPRTAGTRQADPRRRLTPARNIADPLFLPTSDAVASRVMDLFGATSATVQFIAPELDAFWGPQTSGTLAGGNPYASDWDDPDFTAHAVKGSGTVNGGAAEGQSVALHFDGSLPPGSWIRAWPHGRDLSDGRRFRMDGGGARVDSSGNALLLLPLPDGMNATLADPRDFSFDLHLVTDEGWRLYTDRRADRPPVNATGAPGLDVHALPGGTTVYVPQLGGMVAPNASAIPPGAALVAVAGGDLGVHDYTAVDRASLGGNDFLPALGNRVGSDDIVVTRTPTFVQTKPGTFGGSASAATTNSIADASFHEPARGQAMYDFAAFDTTADAGVVGALAARELWHEAPPAATGHAGVSAGPEIHGEGVAIAGPVSVTLRLLMRERAVEYLAQFVETMGLPPPGATVPTAPGPWTALLETAAKGTHGHAAMGLLGSLNLGEAWTSSNPSSPGIKQRIDAVLPSGQTVDSIVDSASFDDDIAAAAVDRLLDKYRNGAQDFARAALAAIRRAEDLIWLQTPAIDDEAFADAGEGDIHLLDEIRQRLGANRALHCLLIIPERHLPDRNAKLEKIRRSAIGAALKSLDAAASDRVAWIAPNAFPGRPYHMAATTLIVDDAIMLTGAAHAWRRGLVFDSALSAAIFDERLRSGRPQAVVEARRLLAGNLLGVDPAFVPLTAPDLICAAKAVNAAGGALRADPGAYTLAEDTTPAAERAIWNPALSSGTDWTAAIAALTGDLATDFANGTRP
jgi:hypothetical protein